MSQVDHVRVFAAPVAACGDGSNPWEKAASMVFERLTLRYPSVTFQFIEIFSPEFFKFPEIMEGIKEKRLETPIIMAGDNIIQNGGKISEKTIRQFLESKPENTGYP